MTPGVSYGFLYPSQKDSGPNRGQWLWKLLCVEGVGIWQPPWRYKVFLTTAIPSSYFEYSLPYTSHVFYLFSEKEHSMPLLDYIRSSDLKTSFYRPPSLRDFFLWFRGGVDFPNPGPMKMRSLWVDTGITQCSGTWKVQPPILLDDFLYTCGRHIAIYLVYRGWTGSNGPCY